jgi:2-polyprenyl-6-methoxyphenol hydroxylase-like FAD-dependent oxidoreductase
MEVEGGRWMVILSGRGEDALPTDEAAFLSFAQSLSDPTIARAIQAGQPCSPMDSYCRTHIQWRHFERLSSGPQNFLVLGDAACVLNPVYGQGMTIAILEAVLLDRCLRQQDHGALACVFQRQQAHLLRRPWQYAERAERLLAGNNTETNWGSRIVRQYIETLMHLVTIDPRASLIFQEYLHMLRSSRSFLHPYLVKQVLRLWVKKWRHGREQRASAQE